MEFKEKNYAWDSGSGKVSINKNIKSLLDMIVDLSKMVRELEDRQKMRHSAKDIYYLCGCDCFEMEDVVRAILSHFNLRISRRRSVVLERKKGSK